MNEMGEFQEPKSPPQHPELKRGAVVLNYACCPKPIARADLQRPGLSSFVCGLLLFMPLITQFYAIGLGLLAVKGKPGSVDKGFGIAGLTLGIAGLLWWVYMVTLLLLGL